MGNIPELNECDVGLQPYEYNVIVVAERVETKTKGGIIIVDAVKEREEAASVKGRLLAVSPLAFNFDKWPDGVELPKVGDLVLFSKYAGTLFEGADGQEYRICKDKDIAGVFTCTTEKKMLA